MKKVLFLVIRILLVLIALLFMVFGILGIRDHIWHLLVIGILILVITLSWNLLARSPGMKVVRAVIVAVLLIYVLLDLALIIAGAIVSHSGASPQEPMTMVILGTDTKGDQPGDLLRLRLERASAFALTYPDIPIIVTGKGRGEYSEAEVMMRYLVDHGVEQARILLEDRAQSTRENFIFSKEIAKKENLPEKFLVVTNDYHQFRASLYAKDYGIETEALSSATTWYMLLPLSERERYLIVTEWLGLSPDLVTKYQEI